LLETLVDVKYALKEYPDKNFVVNLKIEIAAMGRNSN